MSKQYSRRSFLYGAATCGTLSAWGSYLFSAPPRKQPQQRIVLRIASGEDSTGGRKLIVDMWNAMNPDCAAQIVPVTGPPPDQRQGMEDHAKNNTAEVVNLDVIHVAQFAANGWIVPLVPDNPSELLKPLSRTCRRPGDDQTYYAVPFNTDCGILFHRVGVGATAEGSAGLPSLRTLLTPLPKPTDADKRWIAQIPGQANVYGEAFVCNVIEHALAGKASIVGADGKPSYKPEEWTEALKPLRLAIDSGRVVGVADNSTEATSLVDFKAGKAAIMRNWPVRFGDLEAHRRNTNQPWKIEVTGLPHSVLGGQNLAVVSGSAYQAEATALVNFLTGVTAQRVLAAYGFVPTRRSTYNDSGLQTFIPHLGKLRGIVESARPRPVTKNYESFSESFQRHVHAFISEKKDFTDDFTSEMRTWIGD